MFLKNFFFQLIIFSIITVSLILILNIKTGIISVLLGGCAWFIPNVYFFWRIMHRIFRNYPTTIMIKHFFYSEILKLLSSICIISLVSLYHPVHQKKFLLGYSIMIIISLIVSYYLLLQGRYVKNH